MTERARFWRSERWRDAWRPDADLAQAEGLAAGTGLLTGRVARRASTPARTVVEPCPICAGRAEIVVVDLVADATTFRCTSCRQRWTAEN